MCALSILLILNKQSFFAVSFPLTSPRHSRHLVVLILLLPTAAAISYNTNDNYCCNNTANDSSIEGNVHGCCRGKKRLAFTHFTGCKHKVYFPFRNSLEEQAASFSASVPNILGVPLREGQNGQNRETHRG